MKKYANSSFRISLAEQLIYPSPGRLLSTVPWQSGTHLFPSVFRFHGSIFPRDVETCKWMGSRIRGLLVCGADVGKGQRCCQGSLSFKKSKACALARRSSHRAKAQAWWDGF